MPAALPRHAGILRRHSGRPASRVGPRRPEARRTRAPKRGRARASPGSPSRIPRADPSLHGQATQPIRAAPGPPCASAGRPRMTFPPPTTPSDGARHFDAGETLDLVVHPHVLIVLHADAAFGAGAHFAHVILEATQRFQCALEDYHAVAQHTDRVVALHRALDDETTGHDAELAGAEYLAHLCDADDLLLDLRCEHAAHHRLDVVDGLVNDAVVTDLDAGLFHRLARAGIGAHVEADHLRLRGRRELDVRS